MTERESLKVGNNNQEFGEDITLTLVQLLPISWAPSFDLVVLAPVGAPHVDLVVLVDRRLVFPVEERESIFLEGDINNKCIIFLRICNILTKFKHVTLEFVFAIDMSPACRWVF